MPAASPSRFTLLAAALLGAALTARAQTPPPATDPPALAALRAEFLSQVVTGSRQLTEQFSKALMKLEDELAAAGDYEDAIQVQNRRREIDSTLSPSPVAPVAAGIAMPASAAKASSSVTIEGEELTGWRVTGCNAEWTMQRMTPGRYTVRLSYILADAPPSGEPSLSSRFSAVEIAKFKFSEVSLLGNAAANTRLLELARSKDPLTWSALTTEPITISRSTITLKIEALQGYAANIVRIKDIRLVPVEENPALPLAAASTTASGTGVKDVETLRQLFTKQFAAARAPLLADYKARLKTLAAQPFVTKEHDLIEQIEAEQKRVEESALFSPGMMARKRGGAPGGPSGIDGFEDISGARLVADPANTADRFKIEHGGKQMWIKLAWVRCPPATADDKDVLQAATRHFKIDEADALEVGRMARDFTLGYLEDRPLRLLVRGKIKTKDDAAPALVFLDDLGMLFQMVLIDRGFAAFAPPPGTDRRPMTETAMMKLLSDHEQQAMKRNPAPGAWSFHSEGSK